MIKPKILQVCAVDITVMYLLKPLIERLAGDGFEVHIACSAGPHESDVKAMGYPFWPVTIARQVLAWSHFKGLWQLYKLIKRERYDIVHVHTPVAAVLGRIAAKLAGAKNIVYTAHGFYFHEHTKPIVRHLMIWIEKLIGRCCTDVLLSQSQEDASTAVAEKMLPADHVHWIGNGVEVEKFRNADLDLNLRFELGLTEDDKVIGFIGRMVREKGMVELLTAMAEVHRTVPEARLLIIGDTLKSDRDRAAQDIVGQLITQYQLHDVVIFAGIRNDIPELLKLIHIFTLPSHREGMPRSIIEAMASGLPVVATDIRGCREEVIHDETGYIVPLADPPSLASALIDLLQDESKAESMGHAGQQRAIELFDEQLVLDREMAVLNNLLPHFPKRESKNIS
jgi:glycosyltransferase involved in cell wall biosynthesis